MQEQRQLQAARAHIEWLQHEVARQNELRSHQADKIAKQTLEIEKLKLQLKELR